MVKDDRRAIERSVSVRPGSTVTLIRCHLQGVRAAERP